MGASVPPSALEIPRSPMQGARDAMPESIADLVAVLLSLIGLSLLPGCLLAGEWKQRQECQRGIEGRSTDVWNPAGPVRLPCRRISASGSSPQPSEPHSLPSFEGMMTS